MNNLNLGPYEKMQSILKSDRSKEIVESSDEKIDYLLNINTKFSPHKIIMNFLSKIDRFIFKPRSKNMFNTRYTKR